MIGSPPTGNCRHPQPTGLCAAILEGADNDRLIELHALALAETADPPAHAKVDNAVAVAVEP